MAAATLQPEVTASLNRLKSPPAATHVPGITHPWRTFIAAWPEPRIHWNRAGHRDVNDSCSSITWAWFSVWPVICN